MAGTDALAAMAVEPITDGMSVALGTGRAAARGIRALADRVRSEGLRVACAPTSAASRDLARGLGLDVRPLREFARFDYLFDGADEFDDRMRMLKGGGGAMTREKVAASAAARRVYLVQEAKRANPLGRRASLPVEVIRPASGMVESALRDGLGLEGSWRVEGKELFRTEQRALVFDAVLTLDHASRLDDLGRAIDDIAGVIDHGLFLDQADAILVEDERGAVTRLDRDGAGVATRA